MAQTPQTRTSKGPSTKDFTTEDKIDNKKIDFPWVPDWFQSLKKMNQRKASIKPKKITAAMHFWMLSSSFHQRTERIIHTTASAT